MSFVRSKSTVSEPHGQVKGGRLDFRSLLHMLRYVQGMGPFDYTFGPADIEATLAHQGELSIGQNVFHPELGFADVVAIDGDVITIQNETDHTKTHPFKARDFLTQSQADSGFRAAWYAGGAKEWRRRAAKWASLNKAFCTRRGDYKKWLEKHDVHRSSMDDLIRWLLTETKYKAQEASLLPDSGNNSSSKPPEEFASSPSAGNISEPTSRRVLPIRDGPQTHERTADPANDIREENIKKEVEKRAGVVPTYHKTTLFLQRRNIDPVRLGTYNEIKDADKKRVQTIEQNRIDELIDEVLALAFSLPLPLGIVLPVAAREPGTPANDRISANITTEDAEIEADVRSALRTSGVKDAAIKKLRFSRGLGFIEQYRHALKQL